MKDSAWQRFWFAPTPLTRLAACRILILVLALYDVVGMGRIVFADAAAVTAGEATRGWNPIFAFEVLGLQPVGSATVHVVFWVLMASLACGLAGLYTRTACLVTAALAFYWTGLAYSFGKPHHDKIALTFALWVLPWAPVGARLSLDSLRARWRRARLGEDPLVVPTLSTFAAWPLRFIQITIAIGYFFAGASKLARGGLDWMNGYTLQGIMMGHDNVWSGFFSANLQLTQLMAIGLVCVQVTFPLVFLLPWSRWFYLPLVTCFHLMTWKTMDTGPYMTLWGTLVCFLPLERVPASVRAGLETGPWPRQILVLLFVSCLLALVLVVLFGNLPSVLAVLLVPCAIAAWLWLCPGSKVAVVVDGGCGLCRRTLAVLVALDWSQRIEPLNLLRFEEVQARFPALDREACMRDMHVVDARGRIFKGFAAYQVLAWRLPGLAPLAPLSYLPPVAALGRRIYRRVADGRLRDGCGGEVCSVSPSETGT